MRMAKLHVIGVSIVAALLWGLSSGVFAQTPQGSAQPAYLNPSLPIDQRVDDLIKRMTLQEKASQLVNQARAIPRLNVPAYDWWSEALHGVAVAGIATVFPEPIGLAASFDPALIHQMAVVISTEARVKHNMAVRAGRRDIFEGLTFWSPNINIFRDPRWGRGQETYGEDPYLTSRMGVAFVTGMQGDDPKYLRVISTPKHYAVHSGPEPLRHTIDVKVSKHDEEDTYLPAFRATVVEAKAGSVMCVYNSVNGQPGCANDFLLKDQLRGKWKFKGYVVSDCDAVADIQRGHHYVGTLAEAAAVSLKAGTDNDCADFAPKVKGDSDYARYLDAVKQGLITEKDIDVSLRRLFRARMMLGMFDPPSMVKYKQIPDSELDSDAHRQLALQAARETMVLLKNDGTLPLSSSVKSIAVVGPLADQVRVLEGNYNGTPSRATTALEGIRQQFPNARVVFQPGTKFLRLPQPIPASALSTPDGQPGLKAEFFADKQFSGAPIVTRVDSQIDYMRGFGNLPKGVKSYYVRWTGFLTPAESGKYTIGLFGIMERFSLDGKMIVDDETMHPPESKTVEMQLEKGRRYPIQVESFLGGRVITRLVWAPVQADPLGDAIAVVKPADVVVAVVGITSDLEGEEMHVDLPGFKGGDRTSLDLPKEEEDLLEAVKATGKPLVVVLMNGSALSVNWAKEHANAILEAWYSGEEGGKAIAETLAGVNNPAGRLPVTFYKGVDQLPDFTDYAMSNRTYRYFRGEPLYPFGYGLSYSKFSYGNLKLSTESLKAGNPLEVDLDVNNTSGPAGDDVVELYLNFPAVPGAPIRALRGFARVHVDAGASRHVHLTLSPRDLSMVNEAGDRLVAAGEYHITLGGGQPGTGAAVTTAAFKIQGEQKLPE
jgi:beta-glucosidase